MGQPLSGMETTSKTKKSKSFIRPVKILHVGKFFPPYYGGIEIFLADLVKAQVRSGHKVLVLVHDHKLSFKSKVDSWFGASIIRLPTFGKLIYAPLSPTFGLALKKRLEILGRM